MAIRTTRWYPDTCECVLEYSWDDEVAEAARAHNPVGVIRKCAVHAGQDDATVQVNVREENTRKNVAFGLAQTVRVDLTVEEFRWTFRENRDLDVEIVGARSLNATQRTALQTALTTRFGAERKVFVA